MRQEDDLIPGAQEFGDSLGNMGGGILFQTKRKEEKWTKERKGKEDVVHFLTYPLFDAAVQNANLNEKLLILGSVLTSAQGSTILERLLPPPISSVCTPGNRAIGQLAGAVAVVSVLTVCSEGLSDTTRITPGKVSFTNLT